MDGEFLYGRLDENNRHIEYPHEAGIFGDLGKEHKDVAGVVRQEWFREITKLDFYLWETLPKGMVPEQPLVATWRLGIVFLRSRLDAVTVEKQRTRVDKSAIHPQREGL